jgi:hypothetical protein
MACSTPRRSAATAARRSLRRITTGSGNKIFFRPTDNARVPGRGAMGGWDQVRARRIGDAEGRAMMVFFSTCLDTIL